MGSQPLIQKENSKQVTVIDDVGLAKLRTLITPAEFDLETVQCVRAKTKNFFEG